MQVDCQALALEEYQALRATIRERGTLRLFVTAITFVSWAGAALAALALARGDGLASVPGLIVLAAGFEVAFATHVGVERIGRYLQVFYEEAEGRDTPCWEHAIMRFRPATPHPGGPPALAAPLFVVAASLNLGVALAQAQWWPPAAQAATLSVLAGTVLLHAGFILRLRQAVRYAAGQREADLAEFRRTRPVSAG